MPPLFKKCPFQIEREQINGFAALNSKETMTEKKACHKPHVNGRLQVQQLEVLVYE